MAKVRLWFLVMYIKFIEAPPRNLHSSVLLRIPVYCASGVSLLFTQQMPYLATAQCVTGEGEGPPLQDPCLETPMDGGAWWAAGHGVVNSRIRLSNFTFTFHFHALEKEMATPLQCSCLENPRDRGAWWAAIYGVAQSWRRLK